VESAQDILEDLHLKAATSESADENKEQAFIQADGCGLLAAMGLEATNLDALQARTGMDTASLQAQLMALELDGLLTRLPGGLFQRLVRA
jgi:DNA processing protein